MSKRLVVITCALALMLNPSTGFAATVSPSVLELSSTPGTVLTSSFTVFNTGASDQVYFLDLLAFESGDEDGTPVFAPEKTEINAFLSWIEFPLSDVRVPAQSKVDVPFTVAVPDDISAGSYYGAITISTAPSEIVANNGAIVEAKTAVLVFLTIEGETQEHLELLDFSISQDDVSLPFGTFEYRVQNQGNVYLTPTGEITLMGLFGQRIARIEANASEGRVLPSTTRMFTAQLIDSDRIWIQAAGYQLRHLLIGPVTAELSLNFGNNQLITSNLTYWVMPWQLLALMLGLALILIWFTKKLHDKR
ncbi:hypothetical protein HY733_00480 [Candidatus Uhrbacteria bacterium]|nr:hypothetical protein [Candidatus Uhrbacteria bacterium]